MPKNEIFIQCFKAHLPEPYLSAAISQINDQYIADAPIIIDICGALSYFTIWDKTREGKDFWRLVYKYFLRPEEFTKLPPYPEHLLPIPPKKSTIEVLNEIKEDGREQYKSLMDILALTRKEIKEIQTQNAQLQAEIQAIKNILQ